MPRAARHFIIAGPPAAGKGSQCERLVERYGVVHISTGEMLRAEVTSPSLVLVSTTSKLLSSSTYLSKVAKGSELGQQAGALMKEGQLVPDDLIISLVKVSLVLPCWLLIYMSIHRYI